MAHEEKPPSGMRVSQVTPQEHDSGSSSMGHRRSPLVSSLFHGAPVREDANPMARAINAMEREEFLEYASETNVRQGRIESNLDKLTQDVGTMMTILQGQVPESKSKTRPRNTRPTTRPPEPEPEDLHPYVTRRDRERHGFAEEPTIGTPEDSSDEDGPKSASTDNDQGEPTLFHNRKRGPDQAGLKILRTATRQFDQVMDYRTYRLASASGRTRPGRGSTHSRKSVYKLIRDFSSLRMDKFSGKDRILVFGFLRKFVQCADAERMSEKQACAVLPSFLTGSAEMNFNANLNGSREGLHTWPEYVNYLLKTFATRSVIHEAAHIYKTLSQRSGESELDFSTKVQTAAYRCGNAYDEDYKVAIFVNGLTPAVRTLVSRKQASRAEKGKEMSFDDVVEAACDVGEAERGREHARRTLAPRSSSSPNPTDPLAVMVHAPQLPVASSSAGPSYPPPPAPNLVPKSILGANYYGKPQPPAIYPSEPAEDNTVCTVQEVTESTELAANDGDNDDDMYYMHRGHRLHQNQRVPHEDKTTRQSRPGWVDQAAPVTTPRATNCICFDCYGNGHYASDNTCNIKFNLAGFRQVVRNFEGLDEDVRKLTPSNNYVIAQMALDRASGKADSSATPKGVEPKN